MLNGDRLGECFGGTCHRPFGGGFFLKKEGVSGSDVIEISITSPNVSNSTNNLCPVSRTLQFRPFGLEISDS